MTKRQHEKALHEAEMRRAEAQATYDRTKSRRAHVRLVDATTQAVAIAALRASSRSGKGR